MYALLKPTSISPNSWNCYASGLFSFHISLTYRVLMIKKKSKFIHIVDNYWAPAVCKSCAKCSWDTIIKMARSYPLRCQDLSREGSRRQWPTLSGTHLAKTPVGDTGIAKIICFDFPVLMTFSLLFPPKPLKMCKTLQYFRIQSVSCYCFFYLEAHKGSLTEKVAWK